MDDFTIALVGPVGSGKTQFAELLYLTLADLTARGELDGVLNIPVTNNIMELVDDLISRNLGPSRTLVTKEVAETCFKVKYRTFLGGGRTVKIPVADLSGETLKAFMTGVLGQEYFDDEQKRAFLTRQTLSQEDFEVVAETILNSSGLILCANLAYLEDTRTIPADAPAPDPALGTFLAALAKYKELYPKTRKPRAIAVVLTHYDSGVKSALLSKNLIFDSKTGHSALIRYVEKRMVSTNGQLEHLQREWGTDVHFYYSGCEPEVDPITNLPMFDTMMTDRQRFKINEATGRPYYPVEEYTALAQWLKRQVV